MVSSWVYAEDYDRAVYTKPQAGEARDGGSIPVEKPLKQMD